MCLGMDPLHLQSVIHPLALSRICHCSCFTIGTDPPVTEKPDHCLQNIWASGKCSTILPSTRPFSLGGSRLQRQPRRLHLSALQHRYHRAAKSVGFCTAAWYPSAGTPSPSAPPPGVSYAPLSDPQICSCELERLQHAWWRIPAPLTSITA